MKSIITLTVALAVLLISGCKDESAPVSAKETQSQKAQAAAETIQFSENAEIENIKNRLELTANPGLMGFIVLLNETGQPVMHVGVKGKITSGGKRLSKTYSVVENWDCGEWKCDKEVPAASDEGTYGSSGEYIFFWTTSGQYIQWNGKYLYSDKPFRLTTKPLVVSVETAE